MSKIGEDLLELSMTQTDRLTDGQTDRATSFFFIADSAYLGIDRWRSQRSVSKSQCYKLSRKRIRRV